MRLADPGTWMVVFLGVFIVGLLAIFVTCIYSQVQFKSKCRDIGGVIVYLEGRNDPRCVSSDLHEILVQ